ncbi:MAG: hypothetical protein ABUT20_09310 [Bacteroidota bacterium]
MKPRTILLVAATLVSLAVFSQKDYTRWLVDFEISGTRLQLLRIPKDNIAVEVKGSIWQDVTMFQKHLDSCKRCYIQGRPLYGNEGMEMSSYIGYIKLQDPDFPVHYYEEELKAYLDWFVVFKKQQKENQIARMKVEEDSTATAQLKDGYVWIKPAFVWVKAKPDLKSANIGKLYRLSYVKAYEVEGKPDLVELQFGENTGYISEDDLAYEWNDLLLNNDELVKMKSGRYFNFEPTTIYKAQLDKAAAEEERSYQAANATPKRNYIRGPRGGCYYINSHGNKQYVDRSLCD